MTTVAAILASKGRSVITISPQRSLHEAVDVLSTRGVGALVVTGVDGAVLGILSERDVVRVLGSDGVRALDNTVSRIMTSRVKTCTPYDTIDELMAMMTEGRFRHVPVIADGKLAGIVSIGDVVKWRLAEFETEHQAMREYIATA
ncbi:CBS domain-containing protein [Pseudochelatococcus contaminans]|uniref:CBS domain-containing protein n=1 Tax=Pseudochelatococcus contaminans TaxID=1538103 RepID=A0A7W5Z1T0_9HYPH|nr:CBS domain-containing protein [Pseudochelatococcus contaminans]MBB3808452.1 CBS domain-containing protein [Pseudochelatococcus contaminans]